MIMAMNEDEDIANPKRSEKNLNNQDGEYIYTDRFELTYVLLHSDVPTVKSP